MRPFRIVTSLARASSVVALLARLGILALGVASCASTTDVSRASASFLFFGNSLTLHPPSDALGWSGNWGMAASDSSHDYAHVLSAMFPGAAHRQISLGGLETNPEAFDPTSIDSLLALSPTIVVVELGDNATNVAPFDSSYRALLDHVAARTTATILCTTTWFGNAAVDGVIRADCAQSGGRLVDLTSIRSDPQNHASAERSFVDAAVAEHPGDRGMAAIAAALYAALR